jgi:hypothetical protein
MSPFNFLCVLLCCVAVAVASHAAPEHSAQISGNMNSTSTVYPTGGYPFCSQCGEDGEYACSNGIGDFPHEWQIMDPSSSNRGAKDVVNHILVTVRGSYSCDNSVGTLGMDFNTVPLDVKVTNPEGLCACGSCDGEVTFEGYFPSGVPDYVYDQKNTVFFATEYSYACINSIEVTIGWGPALYPGIHGTVVRFWNNYYSSRKVCNSPGYTSTSLTNTFTDPLPEGAVLMMVEADVLGTYFCYSSAPETVLTGRLQNINIAQITLQSPGSNTCSDSVGCDGAVRLSTSLLYQGGWPNYNYGGSNSFVVQSSPYQSSIGQSALYLYYWL